VEVIVTKSILVSIFLIALTDVALQLDNALAISSVASGVPASYRLPVLAGGVLLAACCLLLFTLIGSNLIDRIGWLKPVAGLALIAIGGKLVFDYFRS
jgi:predicted tellurium resistance membrane protein TerC